MAASYLKLRPGTQVQANGEVWTIKTLVDTTWIVATNVKNNAVQILKIADLKIVEDESPEKGARENPNKISDKRWEEAERRLKIIGELIKLENRTRKDVNDAGKKHGVHPATLYEWIKLWDETETLAGLVPGKRGRDPDADPINTQVTKVIDDLVKEMFLHKQQLTPAALYRKLNLALNKLGIKAPSKSKIIQKLDEIPGLVKAKRRGNKRAEEKHSATSGKSPLGKFVMDDYQIDHTPLSIVVVDEVHRLPIRRAYLTLIIEIRSRLIAGFYLSLDPPSTTSVALAIAHAICPKDAYLNRLGVTGRWPIWGKPTAVHADNAGEFRGNAIRLGCRKNDIDLQWRPIKKPHYGAHIEALIGSVEEMVKELYGALFANPKARGSYDSNAEASFTLRELEQALTHWIVNIYHARPHSGLDGRTPLAVFNEGIVGTDEVLGKGLPDIPVNAERLFIDFLPFEKRQVESYGIRYKNVTYFTDELRPFIGEKNKWTKGESKYIVRRDDRAISPAYFLNPITGDYVDVPYADPSRPIISRWELEAARRRTKEIGVKDVDEAALFAAHAELEAMNQRAKDTTTKRRQEQRKKEWAKASSGQKTDSTGATTVKPASVSDASAVPREDNAQSSKPIYVTFDDVELM